MVGSDDLSEEVTLLGELNEGRERATRTSPDEGAASAKGPRQVR